jgi:hypothetical protein
MFDDSTLAGPASKTLLEWVRTQVHSYQDVHVKDLGRRFVLTAACVVDVVASHSFADGTVLCALVHSRKPFNAALPVA